LANAFLVPDHIAAVAAKLVGQDLALAGMISRDLEADFGFGSGSTVRVRVPGAVEAHVRNIYDVTNPLITSTINEQGIDVKLTDHVYNKVVLSEGTLSLDLQDFARQVLVPQTRAVARHVERATATAMKATPLADGLIYDPSDPARIFTAIRARLRANGVAGGTPLHAAVGSTVYAALLDGPTGSAGTTFDADGKVRGFIVVESTRLAADEIIAFVPEAFSLVVRAPLVPQEAVAGASVTDSESGFALRHIRSYDTSLAASTSLVSAFVGVAAMPLAVDTEDGSVDLVVNGGAVRVIAASPVQ